MHAHIHVHIQMSAHMYTHTTVLTAETLAIMEMDLRSFGERPRPFCQTYINHIWNVFQNVCRDLSELRHLVWEWRMGTKHCFNCHVYLHSSVPSYFPSTVSLWIMEIVSLHYKSLNTSIFDMHCFLAQLLCCVNFTA